MKKSLQDILKESGGKDLGLLRRLEDSYVMKGLDWFDKHSGFKKYFPDSKLAKISDIPRDLFVYGTLGLIPGEKQEKYARYMGYDKLKFTRYSIAYGFALGAAKLGAAVLSSPVPILSAGLGLWALVSFADSLARGFYIMFTGKPIGDLVYAEWPYRLGKYFFKKKRSPDTESKNLNSFATLNSV